MTGTAGTGGGGLPDGEPCSAGPECASGYCTGLCCAQGDCCASPSDCPAAYTVPSACLDPTGTTTCQGMRREPACIDFVCQPTFIADDTGCGGHARTCPGNLAPVACSTDENQPIASCPADCNAGPCATNYVCAAGTCLQLIGAGEPCDGSGTVCEAGMKCDHGSCCDENAGPCCTANTEAAACTNGLACDLDDGSPSYACFTTCTPYTSEACLDPVTTSCNAAGTGCVPKLPQGSACAADGQCQSGSCADGVCCNQACDGECASCLGAVTGSIDGICGPVPGGVDLGTCDANNGSCGSSTCQCNLSGDCRRPNNSSCTGDDDCASGYCECANASCSSRKCSATPCSECSYNSNGDATCEGARAQGSTCTTCGPGGCQCDGSGNCDLDNNSACTSDNQCASGNCECTNAACTSKVCMATACPPCKYTTNGSTCTGNRTTGISCGSGQQCNASGQCLSVGTCSCACGWIDVGTPRCHLNLVDTCINGANASQAGSCAGSSDTCDLDTCGCNCGF